MYIRSFAIRVGYFMGVGEILRYVLHKFDIRVAICMREKNKFKISFAIRTAICTREKNHYYNAYPRRHYFYPAFSP